MDWKEHFSDAQTMITTLEQRLARDQASIRYTNLKYKLFNESETKWLYNVALQYDHEAVTIIQQDNGQIITIPFDRIEFFRVRPFYYAACIGSKSFILYAYETTSE